MKVSQELKDEFEKLKEEQSNKSIYRAFATITHAKYVEYETLREFLFTSRDYLELNANQLQFAKWWAGEEEIEVEEELYCILLPNFKVANRFVGLVTYQSAFGSSEELVICPHIAKPNLKFKFTKNEIETHPLLAPYASETFMVKVDDDD